MKKNLISALLALSIVIQGNAIWAEETNTSKDESSSTPYAALHRSYSDHPAAELQGEKYHR